MSVWRLERHLMGLEIKTHKKINSSKDVNYKGVIRLLQSAQ